MGGGERGERAWLFNEVRGYASTGGGGGIVRGGGSGRAVVEAW